MLAAQSLGLGSVWLNMLMKLRHEEPIKTLLDEYGIPNNHIVWATIALGWPISEGVKLQKKRCYNIYLVLEQIGQEAIFIYQVVL